MREAVYHRARAALARQLTAVDPPLSSRDIEAQHQQLEHSVSLIEAEFAPEETEEPSNSGLFSTPSADTYRNDRPPQRPLSADRGDFTTDRDPDVDDGAQYERDDDYDDYTERSRAPLYTILAVLAVVIIGGGALLYAKRDWIYNLAGLSSASQTSASTVAAEPAPVTPATAPAATEPPASASSEANLQKRADRLTNGDAAQEPDNAAAPGADAVAADGNPEQAPSDADETDEPAVAQAPTVPVPVEPVPATPATPQASTPGIVAQRAIFYEQGSDGSPGQAFQGTVTWSQVTRPDASTGIQAVLELPDQNVTVTLSISKNSDDTLPASHLVEIQFGGTGKLGATAIDRVPALVLKPNEQARGQPLSGAAVPVMTNLFWIALSSEDEQVTRNLALLRDGSWFDLPILFTGGKRALLTFEKGIPGDKVFETVLASWGGA